MPITKDQAEMLAHLACAARPHGARRWDAPGVTAALLKVRHMDLAEIMATVGRAAADRELHTPGAIGNPSAPCWRDRPADRTPAGPKYDPAKVCATCGQTETACRLRWTGDHDFTSVAATRRPPATDVHRTVEAIKAEIKPTTDTPPAKPLDDLTPDPRAAQARATLHDQEKTDV